MTVLLSCFGGLVLKRLEGGSVHQVEIHPSVIVVIEPANAASVYFKNVVFLLCSGDDGDLNSGFGGYIVKYDPGVELLKGDGREACGYN
jgi:hypothetical protein